MRGGPESSNALQLFLKNPLAKRNLLQKHTNHSGSIIVGIGLFWVPLSSNLTILLSLSLLLPLLSVELFSSTHLIVLHFINVSMKVSALSAGLCQIVCFQWVVNSQKLVLATLCFCSYVPLPVLSVPPPGSSASCLQSLPLQASKLLHPSNQPGSSSTTSPPACLPSYSNKFPSLESLPLLKVK